MVEGLPPDGALARRLAGHHWEHRDFMLADVVDALGQLVTDFRNVNRAEKTPPTPYPDRAWRPEKPAAKQKRERQARHEAEEARAGYLRIVSQVTPGHAGKR
ncbi:hypothetical protein [Streptomyces sp. NPDC048565]|uniref:hypothetical protein n=1 Tax=Streptomyces sp. NPDC048565 TaxID=3155266 RepID=UPI0034285DE9